ncbi:MAG: pyruvate formate lyase family protein [Candidatus Sumerlaeota bacterium]
MTQKIPTPMITPARREQIHLLKRMIMDGNNHWCFIERETLLPALTEDAREVDGAYRYSTVFSQLMQGLSVPIIDDDVILGRMVEGPTGMSDEEVEATRWQDFCHQEILIGPGHLALDWEELLKEGMNGVARKARETAEREKTESARVLAKNAEMCAKACEGFARRYSEAARKKAAELDGWRRENMLRAAEALEQVPHGPATDYFSALQSIWIIYLVVSSIIGGRDYDLGRMDQYLLELYEKDIQSGAIDHNTAVWLMANFLIKCNENPGTSSQHYKPKPVPCAGNKQYLIIGGSKPDGTDCSNALSDVILEAERLVAMPQPVVVARIADSTPEPFLHHACEVTLASQGLIHFMNDRTMAPGLVRKGIAPEDAYDYGARGCSTIEIPARSACYTEMFNITPWLMEVLQSPDASEHFQSIDDIIDDFTEFSRRRIHKRLIENMQNPEPYWEVSFTNDGGSHFHFDALLMRDCIDKGKLYCQGGLRYKLRVCDFGSLATIADSLMSIQKIVYEEKRFTLSEFMQICENNFEGHEPLRQEILNRLPKYGNDNDEADALVSRLCAMLADIIDEIETPPDTFFIPAVFTLINHNGQGEKMGATPDGRLAGEPLSENQSPTHGADRKGVTSLFKSVAKIPFERLPSGGLNVKFACKIPPEKLASLLRGYFAEGGTIVGFSIVDRSTLEDASSHPERYRSLLVRQTGFSEYFVAMPPHEQLEMISRSEY